MKTLSIWYPSLITRNSSRAWQPLSRVNVTGLLRRFQVKIENIYLFKTLIKKHGNVFKSWLCPNFLFLTKKSKLPKIWGGCSPLAPPARTPMPPYPTNFGLQACSTHPLLGQSLGYPAKPTKTASPLLFWTPDWRTGCARRQAKT